jgi:predicted 3-demethylubiquinone-9 3-methyltransferase (glyoxalase superfamily)
LNFDFFAGTPRLIGQPNRDAALTMPTITPFLWFDKQAEQAAKYYTSIFKRSKILGIARYTKGAPGKVGSVMTVKFRILGQDFTALNGGPVFKFNPAISFVVHCDTQKEIDYYWRRLTAGGKEVQCGWLVDKFGVSWQIVPNLLMDLLTDDKPERTERVMDAVMSMVKIDIRGLRQAAGKG